MKASLRKMSHKGKHVLEINHKINHMFIYLLIKFFCKTQNFIWVFLYLLANRVQSEDTVLHAVGRTQEMTLHTWSKDL